MNDAQNFAGYLFLLALFLIGVAYFAGFSADTKAVAGATNTLLLTATGRNSAGQFAGYPSGAPATSNTSAGSVGGTVTL